MSDFPANDAADNIELEKRARRRLVGAGVLALLAVIVLPLALHKEAPSTTPDMQVSIPERGMTPRTLPEPSSDPAGFDLEPDTISGVLGLSPEALAGPPEERPTLPPPQPAPALSVPAPSVGMPSSERPPPRREIAPQQQPVPRNAAREAEAARVLALLNGTAPEIASGKPSGSASGTAPKNTAVSAPKNAAGNDGKKADNEAKGSKAPQKGQVFIQVGAYDDAARATKQVSELKKMGYAAFTEKADSRTRVRIGPLPREEAQQVAARLKATGRNVALVTY